MRLPVSRHTSLIAVLYIRFTAYVCKHPNNVYCTYFTSLLARIAARMPPDLVPAIVITVHISMQNACLSCIAVLEASYH